ncbi:MAG: lysylphosphatidylglycerol synthase transmembrane domain-containing protein [Candidatus Edwardsbacteria bacterium]
MKKHLWTAIRILISLGLIAFILLKVDLKLLLAHLHSTRLAYVVLAVFGYLLIVFICAYRWRLLLRVQEINSEIEYLASLFFIGLFFNNFLPTSFGGDLLRLYYIAEESGKKSESFASILVDRATGFFATLFVAFLALIFLLHQQQGQNMLKIVIIISAIVALLGVLFFSRRIVRRFRFILNLPLIVKIEDKIKKAYNSIYLYRKKPVIIAKTFLISCVIQFLLVTVIYLLALSLRLNLPMLPFFLYVPVISLISMIPISINAWGLQEGSYVVLFGQAGLGKESALALSLFVHFLLVFISLFGGVIFLIQGGRSLKSKKIKPKLKI